MGIAVILSHTLLNTKTHMDNNGAQDWEYYNQHTLCLCLSHSLCYGTQYIVSAMSTKVLTLLAN